MTRPIRTKQLISGVTWVPIGRYEYHVCCECGCEHKVEYRFNKKQKQFEERWSLIKGKQR